MRRSLPAIAVAHSLLVLLASKSGAVGAFIPGPAWVVLAWSWLLWPLILLATLGRTRVVLAALVLAGLLIVPCVPEVLAATGWLVRGFAP